MNASTAIVSVLNDRRPFCRAICAALTAVLALTATDPARGQTTERVSVSSTGEEGDAGTIWASSISRDGRFVAFTSEATNLVTDDTNGVKDVFLHDRQTGETTRVSVSSTGEQGNQRSGLSGTSHVALSDDGRFVAFWSEATNLVPNDTNGTADGFVHDRQTGETTRVTVSATGEQDNGTGGSGPQSISSDGRFVGIVSNATNLVPDGTNGLWHVFVHDRDTDEDGIFDEPGAINMTLVSVSSTGRQGNGNTGASISIAGDGSLAVFESYATNLVAGDTNGHRDAFVHDLNTGETTRVSVSSAGEQGNGSSQLPRVSADGRFVAFASNATNLVPGDTNGERDIFVHDRQTGQTTRVNVSSSGQQANGVTWYGVSISAEGRFVAFASDATNLVPGDTNGDRDIFVHDRQTGETTRVSLTATGEQGNGGSSTSSISANGRFVAFDSTAADLVPGDTNGVSDTFVRDLDGQIPYECPLCDMDGVCDSDEDCQTCPCDCFGVPSSGCGNGVCEPSLGEDCLSCPSDCNGKQNGNPSNRFCCGDGAGENPVGCSDDRCTGEGFDCSTEPVLSSCCGDGVCEGTEDGFNCEIDCGPPPVCGDGNCDPGEDQCNCPWDCGGEPPTNEANYCADGVDNDYDGLIDCDDDDCAGDPACQQPACDNDGTCEPGEDCENCPNDCDGKTNGPPSGRYCCCNGILEGPEADGRCDGNP
jgi:predicted RNA-binding protein with TRAM domain